MRWGLAFTCRAILWLTTGIRPREWAAVHRRHHAFTDVPGDPHSPVLEGYWQVQLWNVGLYKKAAHDPETLRKYTKDIKVDRWDRFVFDRGFVGLVLGFGLFWALLGWEWALVAWGVHVVGIAANNQWLAFLTWGEGLHSNHHAAPTSARLALNGHEIDPGWWFISFFRRVHLLTVRHSELHLTAMAQQGLAPPAEPERQPELV
jgi:stearoyl-CoA desaturase (delta-9 desaturase)